MAVSGRGKPKAGTRKDRRFAKNRSTPLKRSAKGKGKRRKK